MSPGTKVTLHSFSGSADATFLQQPPENPRKCTHCTCGSGSAVEALECTAVGYPVDDEVCCCAPFLVFLHQWRTVGKDDKSAILKSSKEGQFDGERGG
jgi:hypothetical protein